MTSILIALVLAGLASGFAIAGPILSLDIQESVTPGPGTVTAQYTGSSPIVYVFLVADSLGTEEITAVAAALQFSSNGTVTIEPFTLLTPWLSASNAARGFDPVPGSSGISGPVAIGYWTVSLLDGSESEASLVLMAPGGEDGDVAYVVDTSSRAVAATELRHGSINTSIQATTTQVDPYPLLNSPSYHVLTMHGRDAIIWPAGVVGAPLGTLTSVDGVLRDVLESYSPVRVDKVFPEREEADTLYTALDRTTRILPPIARIVKITCSDSTVVDSLIVALNGSGLVPYAEKNGYVTPCVEPDDPYYGNGSLWHLNNSGQAGGTSDADIDAPGAWEKSVGNHSTYLQIIDSGVDADHEDIGSVFESSGHGGSPFPWHGTHVAGIAAATADNGIGVTGIDWEARIRNCWTDFTFESTAQHLDHTSDVVNMSFGAAVSNETMRRAAHRAFLQDRILVAAMGNDASDDPQYPAGWPIVLAVGATDRNDVIAEFSNTGSHIDVSAPGVDIYSTMPDDGYDDKSGTSMATPVVSGVAGLLLGLDWFMRDVDVEQILERTADDRGTGGFDGHYGWGRVNAQAAAEYAGSRSIMRGETADLYEVGHTEWYNMTWVYPPYQYPTGVYNVRR